MKKLLFVGHRSELIGGAEDDFEKLLKYFSKLSNRFEIHCLIPHGPRERKYSEYCARTGFYKEGYLPTLYINFMYYIKYFLKCFIQYRDLKKFVGDNYYDLVIFNVSVLVFPLYYLNKKKFKALVFIRETVKPDFIRKHLYKFINKRTSNIIAVSETNKLDYGEITKTDSVLRVFSSIEKEDVEIALNSNTYLTENDLLKKIDVLKENYFLVLNIGPVCEVKNQKMIVDSIGLINKNYPDVKIYFVNIGHFNSDDNYCRKLINKIEKYGIAEKCFFTGLLSKEITYEIIKKSNCIIISSLSEGFPLVLVESFMMKKPIISTKVGGVTDVLKNEHNGLLIDFYPESLANALMKIYTEPDFVKALTNEAYSDFTKLFVFEKNIIKIEESVENIING